MLEMELKAKLLEGEYDRVRDALAGLGFAPAGERREWDSYYNAPDRDFRKTDEAVRLRRIGEETLLTYKGPKEEARSNTRRELETAVADGDTAAAILDALGYRAVFEVKKVRAYYHHGEMTACLDRVEGLGAFLELEIVAEETAGKSGVDRLLELLDQLGVSRDQLTRESYLELLMKKG